MPIVLSICACFAAPGKSQSVSVWSASAVPGTVTDPDPNAVELGMKFQSSVAGSVMGIRFYKGLSNTGTHIGHLWSSTGALLASATFSNETASGWQQANFSNPVAIQPNTTYVISYYSPNGHYSSDTYYFNSTVMNPPLTALADGTDGPNGIYVYGQSAFPNQTYEGSNYWVDLVFNPATTPSTAVDSIWSANTVPGTITEPDPNAVELGVKFQSSAGGSVAGVRFYKGPLNTGTHVGHLWSGSGTLLASVTFTNETASGWQQANFSNPVAIQANTTYVVSYYCPNGYYSADNSYFNSAITNAPLTALQDGSAAGRNGVYVYGTDSFPNQSYNASNYWVDLTFVPSGTPDSSTYTISGTVSGSAATLTLSGASGSTTTTNSSGAFSFTGLGNGSYVVAPIETGYTFTPSTATVTVNGESVAGVNFTAAADPLQHSITLIWTASTSPNVAGYNVYRAGTSGGPYTKIYGLVSGTSYVDSTVSAGQIYYYVATAVDSNNNESSYSNEAQAVVP